MEETNQKSEDRMSKERVIRIAVLLSALMTTPQLAPAQVMDWASSPFNWQNSPQNWDNSPLNWRNSPNNWENSPQRFGNDRIIRGPTGSPEGYAVPRQDGGVNFFGLDGNRRGYLPPRQN
ncbi:MAG: hypothetical protein ING26_17405 [Roseomonas sp.]|nr:hypothetical protein [Roseomonas sp.]